MEIYPNKFMADVLSPTSVKWLHKQNQYMLTNLLQSSSHYNVVSLTTLFSILQDLKVVIVKQSYIPYVYFHGVAYIIVVIFHNCCCDCIQSRSKRTHSWRSPQFSLLYLWKMSLYATTQSHHWRELWYGSQSNLWSCHNLPTYRY